MALSSNAEAKEPQAGRTVTIEPDLLRKAGAEFLGTALLVFFGCGVATVTFGFRAFQSSYSAGVVASSLTFGIVMTAMVAIIGPISGSHINPAVTLGALLSRRITLMDAVGYWIAQFVGAILGAVLLYWIMTLTRTSPRYSTSATGLGANGWGSSPASALRITGGGAFLTEIIITAVFVLVVLSATAKRANVAISGAVIGLALALANLVATPVDGASVNPARSFGPALILAGQPIRQVWLFILAPLIGAVLAAGIYLLFHPLPAGEGGFAGLRAQSAVSHSAADEGVRPAGVSTTATASRPAAGTPAPQPAPAARGGSAGGSSVSGSGGSAGDERLGSAGEPDPPGADDTQKLLARAWPDDAWPG
jgi:aquaporin Z